MTRVPVLSVMASRFIGGAEMGWIEIVEHLDHDRVDLRLVCGPEPELDPLAERVEAAGGRVADRLRLRGSLDLLGRRRFARLMRGLPGRGVIHFNQTNLDSCRNHIRVARGGGSRLLATVHDKDRKEPHWRRDWRRRGTYAALDRIVCMSRSIADDVGRYAPADRIEVVPLLLARSAVAEAEAVRGRQAELRAELDLPRDARIAATVSVDACGKGQESLLEHLPAAVERLPGFLLLLVGGDPRGRVEAFLQRAAELGCADAVRWLGFRRDVLRVLTAADCLLHANPAEGLGRVVQEALLVERPVVAYRSGGVLDVLEEDRGGVLVAPDAPADLVTAACDLLDDAVRLRAQGVAGRALVLDRFRADRIVGRYHRLFETLAG